MPPRIVRAARAMLGMSQEELARACMISWTSLNLFEREHAPLSNKTRRAIVRSLEERGIVFRQEGPSSLGIYLAGSQSGNP